MGINFKKKDLPASPLFIVLAFILLIGPFALDFHLHYPDEMYYSDAAVRMIQNHDYLTTYLGNGELRFKKPIATYWGVLAGFQLLGISAFSSRLFFLLAGGFLLVLVYQIGKVTFNDRKIALLATLITASHPVVIFSSSRSIPDILLALFVTLSALGIAGLLKYGNHAPKKYLWMLYLGLGLAFEVKGLPAVAIGGMGILYLLVNPWQRISLKKLFYFPAIIAGLLLASFWFVSMYLKFGPTYINSFYNDQVGARVSTQMGGIITNLALATILMVVMYVPWSFFGFKNFGNHIKSMNAENTAFLWWVVVWIISIIFMSALVIKFYERYLLPVIPLGAVGLAWLLSKNTGLSKNQGWIAVLYVFFVLNVALWLVGLFLNVGIGSAWYIYFGLLMGLAVLWLMFRNMKQKRETLIWMALSILLLFYNGSFITYRISLPHQGEQLENFVAEKSIPKGSNIAYIGHLHTGSKIRIGLGKDYSMTNLPEESYLETLGQYDYIICEEAIKNQLDDTTYGVETAAINWDLKFIPEMIRGIWSGNYQEVLAQKGKRYYWLERE
jgi:4-amino-4-deoxy-L-arabinose transferase-like glycosyltransferase